MSFPVSTYNTPRINVKTTVAIIINGLFYMQDKNNNVVIFPFRFSSFDAATSDIVGNSNIKLFPGTFHEGYQILGCVLSMETAGIQFNQCFVNLDILLDANSPVIIKQLISHSLGSLSPICWPETGFENSNSVADGKDTFTVYHPLNTMVGGIFTVPAGFVIDIDSLLLKVVPTAAIPTDTYVELKLIGQPIGDLNYSIIGVKKVLDNSIGDTWHITFGKNIPPFNSIAILAGAINTYYDTLPIPDLNLIAGDQVKLTTVNVDTANSIFTMRYKRWISQ
ncbi:MAG: hypothetical protein ABR936_11925 [Bacteroidota bacterium]